MSNVLVLDIDGVLNALDHFDLVDLEAEPTLRETEFITLLRASSGFRESNQPKRWLHALRSFDPNLVVKLNPLIEQHPRLRVVVSSTWRMLYSLNFIQRFLNYHGFVGELHAMTGPPLGNRGSEVKVFLSKHRAFIDRYVVFDDNDVGFDDEPTFIRVDPRLGLTNFDVARALTLYASTP